MMHTTLTINLGAICANYRQLQAQLGNATCGAVVKANAYGLGVEKVATALSISGCQHFFVATLEEGIELRRYLAHVSIYVFHGVSAQEEEAFIESNLVPVLNSLEQINCWNNYAKGCNVSLPAILHIDTGMCRLGLDKKSLQALEEDLTQIEAIAFSYIMSHLACADEMEHYKNLRQLQTFEEIPSFLQGIPRSLSNSSGIFLGERYHFDLARPGSALYGVNPTPSLTNPMQGVITLTAPILQLREIDLLQTVGYGASYEAKAGSRIAVMPIGYADGYLRSLSNKGHGIINGYKVPVVGRVSMDLITLDVSAIPADQLYPGKEIVLIGEHLTVDEVADHAGTIGYEVLTHLGKRYKREYVGL